MEHKTREEIVAYDIRSNLLTETVYSGYENAEDDGKSQGVGEVK